MIEKRVTVILYGCDRNLWSGGPLQIRVSDLFAAGGPKVLSSGTTDASTLELRLQLPFDAGQQYGLTFSAPRHRPAWQILRRLDFIRAGGTVEGDDVILRLMLVPDSPGTDDVAGGLDRLRQIASPFAAPGTGIAGDAYARLDVAAQMACLNIEAKLRETAIDGAPLLSFVRGVQHVAVDRAFLFFDAALKPRMQRAVEFAGAAGHHAPAAPAGLPDHPDSWKHTRFAEGNIQLSFSADLVPMRGGVTDTLVHSADVDIDLGRGLAHAKEWLENNVFRPGHKTNQALVYALLYAQNILPQYALDPASATTRSAVPRMRFASAPERPGTRRPPRTRTPTGRKRARGRRSPGR